jgi:hypothetical protein
VDTDIGTDFSPNTSVVLCQYHSTNWYMLIFIATFLLPDPEGRTGEAWDTMRLYVEVLYDREYLFTGFHGRSLRVALYRGLTVSTSDMFGRYASRGNSGLLTRVPRAKHCEGAKGDFI